MRKLVAGAICLLSLSLSVTTESRCIKEARTRTVNSYQNVRSVRGCMKYLTGWVGTALPNPSLGQTGVTNAAS